MMSPRKRKAAICGRMLLRNQGAEDLRLWDRMPPVGREFGSPDFERLMAEDHRHRVGVFDPATVELALSGRTGTELPDKYADTNASGGK